MSFSDLITAFKNDREIHFLVELDFEGWKQRFTNKDGGASIINSGGDDPFFDGLISSISDPGSRFDLSSFRYSTSNIGVSLINKDRFQDNEIRHRLDGGTGKVWVWSPSMDWSDLEDYPVFEGGFIKKYHDKHTYSFSLDESVSNVFQQIPRKTINTDTWSSHRTEGGGGSIAGLPQALIFGDWEKGIPLLCVDTSGYKYLAGVGGVESADADYTATTENVYDKDGSVIAAAGYTFYPNGLDEMGNVSAYFDFTGDQVSNEPLSCSMEGLEDGAGDITGTAGDLIEHPADIAYYLLENFMKRKDGSSNADKGSLKTMRTVLAGARFATIINESSGLDDVLDRILSQIQCARVQRWGKIGVMTFNPSGIFTNQMLEFDMIGKTRPITPTDRSLICNNLRIFYAFNPTTQQWEGELELNKENNETCKNSALQYGERPQVELKLSDVREESVARMCGIRHLDIFAFRHDTVVTEVPCWEGFGVLEGDIHKLTVEEGASADGEGWSQEKCILLDKKYREKTIEQRWWKVSV